VAEWLDAQGLVWKYEGPALPVKVVQRTSSGIVGQVVHGQRVGVAAAYGGELAGVPDADRLRLQRHAAPDLRLVFTGRSSAVESGVKVCG
jgi:hypothetical protein